MAWWQAFRRVVHYEWTLLARHPKLAAASIGLLFVPALYALIYLYGMWDPASHTRTLPAGLVSLDQGASYRGRELNLGSDVLLAIEKHGQFAYQRYTDAQDARRRVRLGELAFLLEVPADFSRNALPGVAPGAGKLTIYTSEGNNYSSAGLARRFAPEVSQRVNTMLSEARWGLVLSSAAGSQRDLETLRFALADLHQGSAELTAGLRKANEGGTTLASGSKAAEQAALKLKSGAAQLAGAGRHLRQVRDSQHLALAAQLLHQAAHGLGHGTADTGIDLVEDQRAGCGVATLQLAGGDGNGERNARQLTARRHLGQRPRRATGVARHQELGRFEAERLRRVLHQQRHLEAAAGHAELLHRLRDGGTELRRGGAARTGDAARLRVERRRGVVEGMLQGIEVGRGIERTQLVFPLHKQRRQVGRRAAIAARQAHPGRQPIVERLQGIGLRLGVVQVGGERVRRVLQLRLRAVQHLDHVGKP